MLNLKKDLVLNVVSNKMIISVDILFLGYTLSISVKIGINCLSA